MHLVCIKVLKTKYLSINLFDIELLKKFIDNEKIAELKHRVLK